MIKTREKPIDIFSKIVKPSIEEAYVRFSNGIIRPISKFRSQYKVISDKALIEELQKQYGKEYTHIHTHPDGVPVPSPGDIITFLNCQDMKTSIIIPLDEEHCPQGYFVMRKNKNHNSPDIDSNFFFEAIKTYEQEMDLCNPKKVINGLRKSAKKLNFSYRFFPVEGVALLKRWRGLGNSRAPLEEKLF